jgi:L-aspartate oxidase
MPVETDTIIIGSGIAGAVAALHLAQDAQRQIALITRCHDPEQTNTRYAQGGIVARGAEDSVQCLQEDVVRAGVGLSLPAAVRVMAEEGPQLVREVLQDSVGVAFDCNPDGGLHYTREGGQSRQGGE